MGPPLYIPIVNTTVTLDKTGRFVIPKPLRDELHLEPGDMLELESEGERVTLRPLRTSAPLRKEHGVWVFRTGTRLAAAQTDDALRESREGRDRSNRGAAKR
jgi:AbrB family looped-hinge helix DNA binding protein